MPKWSKGNDILSRFGVLPKEFLEGFVKQGLTPHHHATGVPLSPSAIMAVVVDKLLDNANNTPRQTLIANEGYCESDIHDDAPTHFTFTASDRDILSGVLRKELKQLKGVEWSGFSLPEDQETATLFLEELSQSVFLTEQIEAISPEPEPQHHPAPPKPRPNQLAKIQCQAVAERLWETDPTISITKMSEHTDIQEAGGKDYSAKTRYNWVQEVAPAKRNKGGRPRKKHT